MFSTAPLWILRIFYEVDWVNHYCAVLDCLVQLIDGFDGFFYEVDWVNHYCAVLAVYQSEQSGKKLYLPRRFFMPGSPETNDNSPCCIPL